MPAGQDSYRPAEAQYGRLAKEFLEGQIPEGSQIRIEFLGTGFYGRYLSVIWKGQLNINLEMVRLGYAHANGSNNPEESQPYLFAEQEAQGNGELPGSPRGVWAQREVSLTGLPSGSNIANSIRTLMLPDDYRTDYAASTDGGHGGTPSACTEGEYDASDGEGDGLSDA